VRSRVAISFVMVLKYCW